MMAQDPRLDALTTSELIRATDAVKTLLDLEPYLGEQYAQRLYTLRRELESESEDRSHLIPQ